MNNPKTSYRIFHHSQPTRFRKVRLPIRPKRLFKLGDLEDVTYRPTGSSTKKGISYMHTFKRGTILASDEKGNLHIVKVGRGYRVKDWIYG